jgi:hypothetical protein
MLPIEQLKELSSYTDKPLNRYGLMMVMNLNKYMPGIQSEAKILSH